MVDASRMVDVDAEPARADELDGQDLDPGHGALDRRGDLVLKRSFAGVGAQIGPPASPSKQWPLKKNGRCAPIS